MVPSSPNTDNEHSGSVDQINIDKGIAVLADGQIIEIQLDFFEDLEIETGLEPA